MRMYMSFLLLVLAACTSTSVPITYEAPLDFETLEPQAAGHSYYVSGTGNDSNDGLSTSKAFRTLQKAADQTQPGDTVLVMNGTYTQAEPTWNVLSIQTSGRADAWIRYKNYPGHTPKIKVRNWAGIGVDGASYILIEGFTLVGNRDEVSLAYALSQKSNLSNPLTSGNCIGVSPKYQSNPAQRAHHIIIRKNNVSKCPGGGIYTVSTDYVRVEDNVVWGNAFYAPYANSGISFYGNWNSDPSSATKMIIARNIVYGNQNLVPFYYSNVNDPSKRTITDGNGIIIDDSRNTQTFGGGTRDAYKGRTYVANNIVYENGARGIHVFSSDHVTVVNNTTYRNSSNPATPEGEITTVWASDVKVYNNILYARSDRPANTRIGTPENPTDKNTQIFDYNLVFSGTAFDSDKTNNILGQNPQFSNASTKDFRLQTSSPAINAGARTPSATRDFDKVKRPLGSGIDIGAFEIK
jgi:parallel beta-helix repeat protein